MELLVEVKQDIAELIKLEVVEEAKLAMLKVVDLINVKLRIIEEKSLD